MRANALRSAKPAHVRRVLAGHVPLYRSETLWRHGVRHAFFTRHGGVSAPPFDTLNLSLSVGDEEAAVAENHRRAYRALGLDPRRAVRVRMVHGTRVAVVGDHHAGRVLPATDGLTTATLHLTLAMTFADCQPILLYDPARHAVALAHAGWRGALGGIALALVRAMEVAWGTRPEHLIAVLGPAIGVCCYEVGEDVVRAAGRWPAGMRWFVPNGEGRVHLNLTAANADVLRWAGVRHVEALHLCTACHTDEFFSYRAEKPVTGRLGVLVALEPGQSGLTAG